MPGAMVGTRETGSHRGAEQGLRGSVSGRKIELHFCFNCGSAVFWYAEFVPDLIGIAFGAFADPSMQWPTVSVWEATRHPWMTCDHELDHFGRQVEGGPGTARRRTHGGARVA